MPWVSLVIAFVALAAALIVGVRLAQLAAAFSAMAATTRGLQSDVQNMQPLTSSSLAALAEMSEAVRRAEELLVKVNRRAIAASKHREDDGTFGAVTATTAKDKLRAMAGLRAGVPPSHQ